MLSFIDHKSIMIQEPFCRLLGEAHVSVLQRTLNEWKAHLEAPCGRWRKEMMLRCLHVCEPTYFGGATFVSFELFDPHPCHSRILWWSELRVSLWPCRCWWIAYWKGAHPRETCTRVQETWPSKISLTISNSKINHEQQWYFVLFFGMPGRRECVFASETWNEQKLHFPWVCQ